MSNEPVEKNPPLFCFGPSNTEAVCNACQNNVIRLSFFANIIFACFKAIIGHLSGSQVLVADAYHSALDSGTMGINVYGVKGDKQKSSKQLALTSGIIALVTFLTGVWILAENISILIKGDAFRPGLMALVVAAFGLGINWYLYRMAKCAAGKQANSAAEVCVTQNKINLAASFISVFGILLADIGFGFFDPLSAILIALVMFNGAYEIFGLAFAANMSAELMPVKKWVVRAGSVLSACIVIFMAQTTLASISSRQNILIPAVEPVASSAMDELLGRAHYYMIFDETKNASVAVDNPYRMYQGEVVDPFASLIRKYNVGVVIGKKIGTAVFEQLKSMGVSIYYDETAGSVQTALADYRAGALPRAIESNVATGFGRGEIRWLSPW